MPDSNNAQYIEWKIWFERLTEFLNDGVILVGHSLGGIFLPKYLSENDFPVKIRATILVAAPFDVAEMGESLGTFKLSPSLGKFKKRGGRIFLFSSKDNEVVPFSNCFKYQEFLPDAEAKIFEDRQHFNQTEFPELIELIKYICDII